MNFRFHSSFLVEAPAEAVWMAIGDFAGDAGRAMLDAAEVSAGAGGAVRPAAVTRSRTSMTIVTCRPPERFAADFRQGGTRGRTIYSLTAASPQETLVERTVSLDLKGAMRLTAVFLRWSLRREQASLEAFVVPRAALYNRRQANPGRRDDQILPGPS